MDWLDLTWVNTVSSFANGHKIHILIPFGFIIM